MRPTMEATDISASADRMAPPASASSRHDVPSARAAGPDARGRIASAINGQQAAPARERLSRVLRNERARRLDEGLAVVALAAHVLDPFVGDRLRDPAPILELGRGQGVE